MLVAGRKDGATFGLNPDSGSILWRSSVNVDANGFGNGLYFGMMADGDTVIAPSMGLSGPYTSALSPNAEDGLYAFDAFTGKRVWHARVSENCDREKPCLGLQSAPIGMAGVTFAGSLDGYVRAYDSRSGQVLWRYDTAREFTAVNGESAKGGAVAGSSIMIGHGNVYVGSGDSVLPGNALLAFSVQRAN